MFISIHISVHNYVYSIFICDTTITTVFTHLLHTYRRIHIYIHIQVIQIMSRIMGFMHHGYHLCHVISSFISWFSSSLRFSLVVLIFLVTCSLYERKSKSLQPRLCVLEQIKFHGQYVATIYFCSLCFSMCIAVATRPYVTPLNLCFQEILISGQIAMLKNSI